MVKLKQLVFFDETMSEPQSLVTSDFTLSYYIQRNPDGKVTEDSMGLFLGPDGSIVAAIGDGIGGHRAGEKASRMAIEALGQQLELKDFSQMKNISSAYELANQQVLDLGVGAGSTLVVFAASQGSTLRFYNAGDSAGVVMGGRGKKKYETLAHSPLGLGIEACLIESKSELSEDLKYMVTNYIGHPNLRIEMGTEIRLQKLDKVLLYSDGFSDNFNVDELPISQSPTDICRFVANEASKRMTSDSGKTDDLAFIVMCQNSSDSQDKSASSQS